MEINKNKAICFCFLVPHYMVKDTNFTDKRVGLYIQQDVLLGQYRFALVVYRESNVKTFERKCNLSQAPFVRPKITNSP